MRTPRSEPAKAGRDESMLDFKGHAESFWGFSLRTNNSMF